jgi:hypothetical protein
MKVLTIVLEEALNGQKKVSHYGNLPLNEATSIILEVIKEEAVQKALKEYSESLKMKEQKDGDNL